MRPYCVVDLPKGQTLIDKEDLGFIEVLPINWNVYSANRGKQYVGGSIKSHIVYLHRMLLRAPQGLQVDHKNGDGLDNRRCNLRLATPAQNAANRGMDRRVAGRSSRFKGVSLTRDTYRRKKPWLAQVAGHWHQRFVTEVEAARAYDAKLTEIFGEFARTNADLGLYLPSDAA